MAQEKIKTNENGCIEQLSFKGKEEINIPFTTNKTYAGPCWYVVNGDKIERVVLQKKDDLCYEGENNGISYELHYELDDDQLKIRTQIKNKSSESFQPEKAGLILGIDTYMDSYPAWNNKYFPTMLRCEKNFFWGYFMSPENKILGIFSPNAVASWSMNYNKINGYGGHRIHTVNIDLLNQGSLPMRYPHHLGKLLPGEEMQWTFYLKPMESLNDVRKTASTLCKAPMFDVERYTLAKGEALRFNIISELATEIYITTPSKNSKQLIAQTTKQMESLCFDQLNDYGVYTITAINEQGQEAELKIYVRKEWSWYLKQARKEAVRIEQKASTHLESWYGCFSSFLASKYFPDEVLDNQAKAVFDEILSLMFDIEKHEPIIMPKRICNTASMISLLVDVYEANKEGAYLKIASGLADWLMSKQGPDGAYRTETGWGSGREDELGEHYTSVIYMAKSMLELVQVERTLGESDGWWKEQGEKHYFSAKAAVDDLQKRLDDIGTEGEHAFEDGMISCSSLQLGMFALMQEDERECKAYVDAAQYMLQKHTCLEQQLVPDCRMNGCTIRFWEAQYDVLLDKNMINSPHGWTSWKTYATWYLYQLTGDIIYLKQTMDTLGACMQLIDLDTGTLRWAFIVDPYVPIREWKDGQRVSKVIGEDYVNMISGWYKRPTGQVSQHGETNVASSENNQLPEDGWCCDNDVHEHFKCLEEVALTSAYVYENEDGKIETWNCRVNDEDGCLTVKPYEAIVTAVHINIKTPIDIDVEFDSGSKKIENTNGMFWIRDKK